jgi:alpha-glucoside transport system permease protein
MQVATHDDGVRFRRRSLTSKGGATLAFVLSSALLIAGSFVLRPAGATAPALFDRLAAGLIGAAGVAVAFVVFLASERSAVRRASSLVLASGTSILIAFLYMDRDGARAAVVSVILAVSMSAALFVGVNRLLDQAAKRWVAFSGITGTIVGAVIGLVLVGNRTVGFFAGADEWLIAMFAVVGLGFGLLSGTVSGPLRLPLLVLAGAGSGALAGIYLRVGSLPRLDVQSLALGTVLGAAVLGLVALLRGRSIAHKAVTGAAFGWLIGAFGFPDLGSGTLVEGLIGTVGFGALLGLRMGITGIPEISQRIALESRVRTIVFLGPALTFVGAMLVIPTIRTMYLALLDRRAQEFVGLDNFRFIFRQPSFLNVSAWRSITDSTEFLAFAVVLTLALLMVLVRRFRTDGYVPPRLAVALGASTVVSAIAVIGRGALIDLTLTPVIIALAALLVGVLIALFLYARRHSGNSGFDSPGGGLLVLSMLLLSFAFFTNLRGTLMNNLWWVVVVTVTATGLGLAIAALADRSAGESVAKSLIFMPMALSFVGASLIWRFMYISRLPDRQQTGVLNALWVGLGRQSVSDRAGTIAIVLLAIAVLLALFGIAAFRSGAIGSGWTTLLLAGSMAWFGLRFNSGQGIAGVRVVDGQTIVSAIQFLDSQQFGAYNNIFVMVPFIWIYTGFAMVIFSAAIKGVPADLLEAGRVDGATDSQSFWRIVLPQIRPTIGVVLTTIIVVVMKVFDIVKVMTNGQFGTQVLANEMYNRSFLDGNYAVGSAVAVVLFLSVLPVMFVNIRRMQKDAA